MFQLRPDQSQALDRVRAQYRAGKRAPLLVAPTGFGKTVCFSEVARGHVQRGGTVHIHVHRAELVDQVVRTLAGFGVQPGVIAPDYPYTPRSKVQVASVFTLIRRLNEYPAPTLIVVDEAHHCTPHTTWGKILAQYPKALRLGVTATPLRMDGSGLADLFDTMVLGPTVSELQAAGNLCPLQVFAPPTVDLQGVKRVGGDFVKSQLVDVLDKPQITGSAVEHYRRLAHNKPAVVFTVSVAHAEHVATQFRDAGYQSVSIDGTMHRDLRRQIVADFTQGKIHVLTSCDLVSEGFDCPRIEVGLSLRPTQSVGLWLQQVGRILRTYPGKQRALLLDHAGNTLRHGLPTDERDWTLVGSGREGRAGGAGDTVSVRICPACFAANPGGTRVCRSCGKAFPVEAREVEEVDGELHEITPEELAARRERQKVGLAKSLDSLIELGRMRGYRNPATWAAHVMAGREKKKQVK